MREVMLVEREESEEDKQLPLPFPSEQECRHV